MAREWQIQKAKSELNKVVEDVLQGGPQVITKRSKHMADVLSYAQQER
jgi:prevent-host-death family protein